MGVFGCTEECSVFEGFCIGFSRDVFVKVFFYAVFS